MAKKYRLLDERSLIEPSDRPYLAFYDFGISLGILWALVVVTLTAMGINGKAMGLVQFFATIYPGYSLPPNATDLLLGLIAGFVHGFLFGIFVAYLYNIWRGPQPFGVKLLTDLSRSNQPVMVSEGRSMGPEKHPYTIAIIANPLLESELDGAVRPDPILKYPKLFQAKVAGIIGSLASDSMIREEFLEKIRILTLFDPALGTGAGLQKTNALCLEHECDIIIEPIQRVYQRLDDGTYSGITEERLLEFLKRYPLFYDSNRNRVMVDVVYVITASTTHTRSSSRYTVDDDSVNGPVFVLEYEPDAEHGKRRLQANHNPYTHIPGMVAYSAWDNRLKTPLHEFAHAMSSTTNGAIVDEYYDEIPEALSEILVINKRHVKEAPGKKGRQLQTDKFPEKFGTYIIYQLTHEIRTDKVRSVPESWRSFVPARRNPYLPCTMDLSGELYEFDLMIQNFMHDRLQAKVERRIEQ